MIFNCFRNKIDLFNPENSIILNRVSSLSIKCDKLENKLIDLNASKKELVFKINNLRSLLNQPTYFQRKNPIYLGLKDRSISSIQNRDRISPFLQGLLTHSSGDSRSFLEKCSDMAIGRTYKFFIERITPIEPTRENSSIIQYVLELEKDRIQVEGEIRKTETENRKCEEEIKILQSLLDRPLSLKKENLLFKELQKNLLKTDPEGDGKGKAISSSTVKTSTLSPLAEELEKAINSEKYIAGIPKGLVKAEWCTQEGRLQLLAAARDRLIASRQERGISLTSEEINSAFEELLQKKPKYQS